jgi:excisionase family DNA binding protein
MDNRLDVPGDTLLDVRDVMKRLHCGRSTAYALIKADTLPAVNLGRGVRVPASAVDAFIRAGGVPVIPKAGGHGATTAGTLKRAAGA